MTVSVTEATRQRLAKSKAVFGPEHDMSILDSLAVPKNFDDLVMQIQAKDCNMFFPMVGMPRAYMEIPIWSGRYKDNGYGGKEPDYFVERWVYCLFGWWAKGTRSETESLLCEAIWKDFVALRKEYAKVYGDASPVIVWRRMPEIEERPAVAEGPCFEHNAQKCKKCTSTGPLTRISMRLVIPGLDLRGHDHCSDPRPQYVDATSPQFEVVPEPVK